MHPGFLVLIIILVLCAITYKSVIRYITVYEYQRGLLYRKGKFVRLLPPGRYRYLKSRTTIAIVDARRAYIAIPAQEILTKDQISVKVTLGCTYEMTDPVKAKHSVENFLAELYNLAQIALREIVSGMELETLLAGQSEVSAQLLKTVSTRAGDLGLTVHSLALRDVMLPANLKKAFAGVMEAKKDAQRQLENARGEQAVLRNLANAAALFKDNPALLQARIIQALSGGNHTLVFGADSHSVAATSKKE